MRALTVDNDYSLLQVAKILAQINPIRSEEGFIRMIKEIAESTAHDAASSYVSTGGFVISFCNGFSRFYEKETGEETGEEYRRYQVSLSPHCVAKALNLF